MTMARKKMDKLSQEVAKALACGMSYGKWKAMQKPVKIVPKKIPDEFQEHWSTCEYCGKQFKLKTRRPQRFCDVTCQKNAYYENNRERMLEYCAKYRQKVKAAAMEQE
jgi:hypothetical protein